MGRQYTRLSEAVTAPWGAGCGPPRQAGLSACFFAFSSLARASTTAFGMSDYLPGHFPEAREGFVGGLGFGHSLTKLGRVITSAYKSAGDYVPYPNVVQAKFQSLLAFIYIKVGDDAPSVKPMGNSRFNCGDLIVPHEIACSYGERQTLPWPEKPSSRGWGWLGQIRIGRVSTFKDRSRNLDADFSGGGNSVTNKQRPCLKFEIVGSHLKESPVGFNVEICPHLPGKHFHLLTNHLSSHGCIFAHGPSSQIDILSPGFDMSRCRLGLRYYAGQGFPCLFAFRL